MKKEKELKPEGVKNKYIDHVEAERLGDLARERERDRLQFEMFEDPTMNWSGKRQTLWECFVTRTSVE